MSDDKFVNELTQIEEEQRALDARRAAIKKQVVERVKVMIRTYHLTTDDITVPAPGDQDDDGRIVKYRDADGNTWTGCGRKPKWLIAAINAGASRFTHTYNGQRGLHHREPGVVGAAMSTPETYAEIICDGKHVNPAAIKALLQAKGWQHTVLITDCLGCGGMPEGSYTSGGMDVIMKDNLCWLADGKSIAGSVLTLAQGVKNIVDWGIASADIAIRMATEVPARSAHIEDKCGSIMPGRDADFVVFDHELTLVETYVGGQSVGNAFTD